MVRWPPDRRRLSALGSYEPDCHDPAPRLLADPGPPKTPVWSRSPWMDMRTAVCNTRAAQAATEPLGHPTHGASRDLASGRSRGRAEGKRAGSGSASFRSRLPLRASCCLAPSSPLSITGAGNASGADAAARKGLGTAERR